MTNRLARLALVTGAALAMSACGVAPSLQSAATPTTTCATDGTVFAHGSCILPDDVTPGPRGHVADGAPSKVCNFDGHLFECPASYEVPEGAVPGPVLP